MNPYECHVLVLLHHFLQNIFFYCKPGNFKIFFQFHLDSMSHFTGWIQWNTFWPLKTKWEIFLLQLIYKDKITIRIDG